MARDPNCEDCNGLWDTYRHAVMEHIQISSKLQMASISQDTEAIKTLEVLAQAAEQARKEARQTILNHEASAHPGQPPSNPEDQQGGQNGERGENAS
jgi:hypothetical protein